MKEQINLKKVLVEIIIPALEHLKKIECQAGDLERLEESIKNKFAEFVQLAINKNWDHQMVESFTRNSLKELLSIKEDNFMPNRVSALIKGTLFDISDIEKFYSEKLESIQSKYDLDFQLVSTSSENKKSVFKT